MCPAVGYPDLVLQKTGDSQSRTHTRPAECGSRRAIQARLDHPYRLVSPSRGLPINMQQVASLVAYLSLVLHQLTKAPFESIREASLKHLTFKTVFLLALGVRSMLGKTRTSDTSLTGQRCLVPLTQLSFQEPAGQRKSKQCDPSGYTSPGPNSG